jgi:pimeloyl-ACP methyl ester carboxylesterase
MRPSDPILLLHGQPGKASDWDGVRAALGGRAETIAIDRPGWNGKSSPADLEGNARAALAALDSSGAERAVVVGHSFGGAVAAWLAASQPHRVRALVLAAPSANAESLQWLDRALAAPGVGFVASAAALAASGVALAARPLRTRIARDLELEERYLRSAGRILVTPHAWRAFFQEQRLLVRDLPMLEPRLGQIAAPTTIVIGVADRVVPLSSARRLAEQIPYARLVELERANHLLPQQRPERLAELIVEAGSGGRRR